VKIYCVVFCIDAVQLGRLCLRTAICSCEI